MRLLTKTTIYFLIALIPILVTAGFFLFESFSNELNRRMDEELLQQEAQWIRYLQSQAASGTTVLLQTQEVFISPVDVAPTRLPRFSTIAGEGEFNDKAVPVRQLTHVVEVYGIPYLIQLKRSQQQRLMLVANVTRIMFLVFVTLFIFTILVNFIISQSVWKPFKSSLQKIRNVELQKIEAIHFEKTNIKEFNELNDSLNHMVGKIYQDYISIREFTENAAHEMQTPLAVAQSKLEVLLQDEHLADEQVKAIIQAGDSLSRLSKLNQSLLLLAKIENNQFATHHVISLRETVNKYLELFNEMLIDKNITVSTNMMNDWKLQLHPFLADSLISNLLGNAIKYNKPNGQLYVRLVGKKLVVSNTSLLPAIESTRIFKRFISGSAGSHSTGLGLAIAKKICDMHSLNIRYNFANGLHEFEVSQE